MRRFSVFTLMALACGGTTTPPTRPTPAGEASALPSARPQDESPSAMGIPTAAGDLTLEMGPDDVESACRAKRGRAHRFLTSNRVAIDCEVGGATFSNIWVGHCPIPENRHVCFLTQSTPPMTAERAEQLRAKVATQLTSVYGERIVDGDTWSWPWRGDGKIDLSTEKDSAGTRVTLFHGTAEGIKNLLALPPEFPSEVAGFRFGATELEARAACDRNGGEFVDGAVLRAAGVRSAAPVVGCDHPHVDLPFEVKNLFAKFCDERICELGLILNNSVDAALAAMSGKYGAPRSFAEPDDCKASAARHLWVWGADGVVMGTIKLSDYCGAAVYYDNAAGHKLKGEEFERRQQNF